MATSKKIKFPLVFSIAFLLVAIVVVLALTHTGPFTRDTKQARAASSAKQHTSEAHTKNKPQPATNSSPASSNSTDKTTSNPTATLIAPSGTFVSNHHPTLSGKPGPYVTSTCSTTVGASCRISFTKDGVTESLPVETTDSTGSAYWDWKLQDYGITAGTWKVKATATLGNQTQTTSDLQDLVVAQ